jgi:AhpC/TSA family protein
MSTLVGSRGLPKPLRRRDGLDATHQRHKLDDWCCERTAVTQVSLDFTLPAAGGGDVSLAEVRDGRSATVVVFTCNHCPYALAWHERVQQVARDYADRGVGFVQINPNDPVKYPKDSFDAMTRRVEAGEFASAYLWDESQQVARNWRAKVTPHVFVLDSSGAVAYQGAPDDDYGDELLNARWLRAALDDVLAGRAASRADTKPRGCSIKWKKA